MKKLAIFFVRNLLAGMLLALSLGLVSSFVFKQKDPLASALSGFAKSEIQLSIKNKFKIGGNVDPSKESNDIFKLKGRHGFSARISSRSEFRQIWNPEYVAKLQKVSDGNWLLLGVFPPDSQVFADVVESCTVPALIFRTPIYNRLESIEPIGAREPSGETTFEQRYSYVSGSGMFTTDQSRNSMLIKYEEFPKGTRIVGVRYWETEDIENIGEFDYPDKNSYIPEKLTMTGTNGKVGPEKISMEQTCEITVDNSRFDRAECYLAHYELPEPTFARKSRLWPWASFCLLVVFGVGAILWIRRSKSS